MADAPQPLRDALAERYELDRAIGRGGMATVYLAQDVRHRRQVAVKVLRPDLAAVIGTDRFLKEIEISANLTHPHIVPLYDSGEAEGQLYYVMPLIKGESLRSLLVREHRLEEEDALDLIRSVADAVAYAHRQGVVHRDLKPENILISEGHPVVTDFGIAKALTSAADGQHFTRTGLPIGTPGYMSPEQAAGSRDLDERTDVYGLACVLYEMLVGDVPGFWITDESVKLGRFTEALPEHRRRLDGISGRIERALVRSMAMQAEKRIPTVWHFVAALNDATEDDHLYSDTEFDAIVERAADLQADNPTRDGLTVGAVEQAAAEVGISPERVQNAMHAMQRPGPAPRSEWGWFLGAETAIRIDRTVDGEAREADFPLLVGEVRTTLGNVGHTSTLGNAVTWTTSNPVQGTGRNIQVLITPRDGQTRIFVQENLSQLAGGLFGGIMGGAGGGGGGMIMGIVMASVGVPVIGLAGMGIAVLGSWGLAKRIFTSTHRRRRQELEQLVDRIEQEIKGRALPPGN